MFKSIKVILAHTFESHTHSEAAKGLDGAHLLSGLQILPLGCFEMIRVASGALTQVRRMPGSCQSHACWADCVLGLV